MKATPAPKVKKQQQSCCNSTCWWWLLLLLLLLLAFGLLGWVIYLQVYANNINGRKSWGACPPDPSQCVDGNTWLCANGNQYGCNQTTGVLIYSLDGFTGATGSTGATGATG